jgi:hypothetical protein
MFSAMLFFMSLNLNIIYFFGESLRDFLRLAWGVHYLLCVGKLPTKIDKEKDHENLSTKIQA